MARSRLLFIRLRGRVLESRRWRAPTWKQRENLTQHARSCPSRRHRSQKDRLVRRSVSSSTVRTTSLPSSIDAYNDDVERLFPRVPSSIRTIPRHQRHSSPCARWSSLLDVLVPASSLPFGSSSFTHNAGRLVQHRHQHPSLDLIDVRCIALNAIAPPLVGAGGDSIPSCPSSRRSRAGMPPRLDLLAATNRQPDNVSEVRYVFTETFGKIFQTFFVATNAETTLQMAARCATSFKSSSLVAEQSCTHVWTALSPLLSVPGSRFSVRLALRKLLHRERPSVRSSALR